MADVEKSDNHSFTATEVSEEEKTPVGVAAVEATNQVYGLWSKIALFTGLALASYVYSLDGSTSFFYLNTASSEFKQVSLISSILVAQSVIVAVGKPVIAKIADLSSRGIAFFFVLFFYVIGYVVIAAAPNIQAVAGGIVLYSVGYTGLQILLQIIIADTTTLKWRGLVSSLVSAPFIINAFVGSLIYTQLTANAGWRWGYGVFAILMPVALAPLIITLLWAEWKARKLGLVKRSNKPEVSAVNKITNFVKGVDVVGIILLGAALALILIPLTLAQSTEGHWQSRTIIALISTGAALLVLFILWTVSGVPSQPLIPLRLMKNRSVVLASVIGFFDFVSFYLTFIYLFTFILTIKDWSNTDSTYFVLTQSVALTVFAIMAGAIMRVVRRAKYVLATGLAIRLLGVGLMLHSRSSSTPTVELVFSQVLQGLGGGVASVASQVTAQASVPHSEVAMATAVVLLLTEIGGAVGSALAGALWTNTLPGKLAEYLPQLSEQDRANIFGGLTPPATYPIGSEIREAIIGAYADTMRVLLIVATAVSVIPLLASLLMPNWYLGDEQNAVDKTDLTGKTITDHE